ncbi:lytic polysaccharide monooxygenase auxiliary activity family 9 protein [Microbispora amethystogenes]|uniref:lytic polysaccharide monooxygenase auxiliary activity family 9 protein n=1 Tax=Microbispora amethystogenes TaxID=1427754 RepID=UPI001EF21754|nr:lytic polysaccharide monooxygenase [Microbispora amethystogenes]
MGRPRRTPTKATIGVIVAALSALVSAVVLASPANAHGAPMTPGSRTYLCWKDGTTSSGAIQPKNPACAAAVAKGGTNALYNWFAVLRSDGAGRMSGFIPDGQLCSGGAIVYDFSGFDLARDDWPVTHLTSGATIQFKYNKWAAHPGTFRSYITKDSWSPTRALAWSDLESTPFDSVTNPPSVGSVGTEDGHYYWDARLPSGKSGRHIIYTVWQRSDSNETFYSCSDVVFDGGNGEVTGVGQTGTSTPTPPVSPSASPSITPKNSPSPPVSPSSSPSSGPGGCSATYKVVSSWGGGFQGEVSVKAGSSSIGGWTVKWTQPSGGTITQVWNGTLSQSGSNISVQNVNYNGSLGAGASTTFGFLANGTSSGTPSLTCSAA